MESSDTPCEVLLCDDSPVAEGPRSSLRLCQRHLEQEIGRVRSLKQQTDDRILGLKDSLELLQPRQQKLEADQQELETIFDELQAGVQRWRSELLTSVGGQSESVLSKIRILQHVASFQEQLAKAEAAADYRRLYELVTQVEPSLEALGGGVGADGGSRRPAALDESPPADVCSAVRNAQFSLDRRVAPLCGPSGACELVRRLAVGAEVECVTVCTDAAGFSVRADGRLAGGNSGKKVATPAAVVSLDPNEGARHLLLLSLEPPHSVARCEAALDWSYRVQALHCDSRRRLLLVAQGNDGVTVCNLAGVVKQKISGNSLGRPLRCARGLAAAHELGRVFVLDGDSRTVLALNDESYELEDVVDIAEFFDGRPGAGALAASGGRLLIADTGGRSLHKVCAHTRRLLRTLAADLRRPAGVVVDSRGVVCVSDSWGQVVRLLLLADGSLVHTIGVEGEAGDGEEQLDGPQGLALLEADGCRRLLVADWRNQAIRVYELR